MLVFALRRARPAAEVLQRTAENQWAVAWRSTVAEMKSLAAWFLNVLVAGGFGAAAIISTPDYADPKVAGLVSTMAIGSGLLAIPVFIWIVKLLTMRTAKVKDVLSRLVDEGRRLGIQAVQPGSQLPIEAADSWGETVSATLSKYFGDDAAASWQSICDAGKPSQPFAGLASQGSAVLKNQIEAAVEWIESLLNTGTVPGGEIDHEQWAEG